MSSNLKLALQIIAQGAAKTVGDLLKIQDALDQTSNAAKQTGEGVEYFTDSMGRLRDAKGRFVGIGKEADGARLSIGGLSEGIGGLAFKFNEVLEAAQTFFSILKPAYDLLIASNEKLNQQLLSSQTTLAATNDIFRDGIQLNGVEAIQATREELRKSIKQIEQDTQSLVGVTSEQVNELFAITLSNAGELANQSKEFPGPIEAATQLTKGWAASLGTLNIPLDQARQEINSIVRGQIDQNSILGQTLKLTPALVKQYKEQGILVDELNKRLGIFVEGNSLAARSISGVSSNILDLVQRVGRELGVPLLDPLIESLSQLEQFLKKNETTILATGQAGIKVISDFLGPILDQVASTFTVVSARIQQFYRENEQGLGELAQAVGPALQNAVIVTVRVFELLQGVFLKLADNPYTKSLQFLITKVLQVLDKAAQLSGKALEGLNDTLNQGTLETQRLYDSFQQAEGGIQGLGETAKSNIKIVKREVEDFDKALKEQAAAYQVASGEIAAAASNREAEIAEALASGQITEEQARRQSLQAERQFAEERIALNEQRIKDLQVLEEKAASPEDKAKIQADILKFDQETANLRKGIAQKELEDRKRVEQERLQAIEDAAAKASDVVKAAETSRLIEIQKLLNSGAIDQSKAEQLKLDSVRQRIDAELKAEQDKLAQLQALERPTNSREAEAFDNRIRDQQQRIAELTLQRLENERQKQEQVKQAAIKAIQEQAQARKNASDLAIAQIEAQRAQQKIASDQAVAGYDREKAALEAIGASLDSQNKLFQSRVGLQKAISDQAIAGTDIDLSNIIRAQEITRQLNDGSVKSAEERQVLERELQALGFTTNTTEEDFLKRRQQLEERLAAQKREALLAEQAAQRVNLEFEIKRNELAAARAVIEAKIAENKAKQALADAQSNQLQTSQQGQQRVADAEDKLKEAQAGGDKQAISEAQTQLDIAKQQAATADQLAKSQVDLAAESVGLAKDNVAAAQTQLQAQSQLAIYAQQTLDIQQKTALAQADAADKTRQYAQELEAARAKAEGLANQLERAATASGKIGASISTPEARRLGGPVEPGSPYLVGEEGPELIVPRRSGYVLTARQTAALMDTPRLTQGMGAAMGGGGSQLLREIRQEIQGLRREVASRPPAQQNNSFTLQGVENLDRTAVDMAADLAFRRMVGRGFV